MTKQKQKESSAAVWQDVGALIPWAENPRINDHAVNDVANSIKRFGFAAPIIARQADGMVIAGHTRLKAAQKLGLKTVPVRYMDLDPADSELLALADNKLNEKANWDDGALAGVLSRLSDIDLDLGDSGFDPEEIGILLNPPDYEARDGEELNVEDFDAFEHRCPRCSFEWSNT